MSNRFVHSAELRWFLPEQGQQEQLLKWFTLQDQLRLVIEEDEKPYIPKPEAGPFVKKEKDRWDKYLLIPDSDTVGVKQRQGKLEVKALVAGPWQFSQGAVIGRVDQWVKWSFDPSEETLKNGLVFGEQLENELDQSGPWRRVEKIRYLQKYSFDSDLVAVSPDQRPITGCNIELTVINVKANIGTWLTFGLEAFGSSGRVMAILDEAVQHYFTAHGPAPVQMDGRDSLSYPAWLAMLR